MCKEEMFTAAGCIVSSQRNKVIVLLISKKIVKKLDFNSSTFRRIDEVGIKNWHNISDILL